MSLTLNSEIFYAEPKAFLCKPPFGTCKKEQSLDCLHLCAIKIFDYLKKNTALKNIDFDCKAL